MSDNGLVKPEWAGEPPETPDGVRVYADRHWDYWLEIKPGRFGMRAGDETFEEVVAWYHNATEMTGHDGSYTEDIVEGNFRKIR